METWVIVALVVVILLIAGLAGTYYYETRSSRNVNKGQGNPGALVKRGLYVATFLGDQGASNLDFGRGIAKVRSTPHAVVATREEVQACKKQPRLNAFVADGTVVVPNGTPELGTNGNGLTEPPMAIYMVIDPKADPKRRVRTVKAQFEGGRYWGTPIIVQNASAHYLDTTGLDSEALIMYMVPVDQKSPVSFLFVVAQGALRGCVLYYAPEISSQFIGLAQTPMGLPSSSRGPIYKSMQYIEDTGEIRLTGAGGVVAFDPTADTSKPVFKRQQEAPKSLTKITLTDV